MDPLEEAWRSLAGVATFLEGLWPPLEDELGCRALSMARKGCWGGGWSSKTRVVAGLSCVAGSMRARPLEALFLFAHSILGLLQPPTPPSQPFYHPLLLQNGSRSRLHGQPPRQSCRISRAGVIPVLSSSSGMAPARRPTFFDLTRVLSSQLDIQAVKGEDLLAKFDLKANDAILAEEKHMSVSVALAAFSPPPSSFDRSLIGPLSLNSSESPCLFLPLRLYSDISLP